MSIVLLILQILGILLGILLFVAAVVLFAPIGYQVQGDIHEEKWVKLKVTWLLHMVSFKLSYEGELVYGEGHIFWKKLCFSYDLTSESEKEDTKKKQEAKKKKTHPIEKIKAFVAKIKIAYPGIRRILGDDRNKRAVIHLKKELVYLIQRLLPKKSKVYAVFSTGAPDTTGQLCGILALFPLMYQNGWQLQPDFAAEHPYFEGSFSGRGRWYLFQPTGSLLRIVFDKNCRRLYTMIDRLMKRLKKESGGKGNG